MDVSICIINYNTCELTKRCIQSVLDFTSDLEFEIIVVDNGSQDQSVDVLTDQFSDRILLLKKSINRFFSGGFNDAVFMASGKYSLILNSDTYMVDNSIKLMFEFMESHLDVGAVEGCIIDEQTNEITPTSTMELTPRMNRIRGSRLRRFLNKTTFERYSMPEWDRKSDREVAVICDAFMMVNTALFRDIGGYNEALKLFFTEEYICDQIRSAGRKLVHLGSPKVYHAWSSSTKKLRTGVIRSIYKSDEMMYFALKYQ